ncbi:MAG: sulfite exporter TauE/SafE family protein [Firmicutes bacterium]|nr:sulfite exporter TauE/SafE family protein [Bacillota bacterium]
MITALLAALSVGLLQGFLHCAGMCGPFTLAFSLNLPRNTPNAAHPIRWIALHNGGRILGFTLLGTMFGLLGSFVDLAGKTAGVDGVAGLIGGTLMMIWAVQQLRTGHALKGLERFSPITHPRLKPWLHQMTLARTNLSSFLSGVLLGTHPCGLLFAMLLGAAAAGAWWRGGLTLLAFGVGTVPAILTIALAGFYGRRRLQGRWATYLSAALIGLSGLLFALRGLSVNGLVPDINPWLF